MEAKVNAFLHANAASRLINEPCGPFHIGFDGSNGLTFLNYAVPASDAEPTPGDIAALVAAFQARGRTPRLEFAPAGAPAVEPALLAEGFDVEQRLPFMICEPDQLVSPAAPEGVEVVVLTADAAEAELRGAALIQQAAFHADEPAYDEADLARDATGLRSLLTRGGCVVLARGAAGTAEAGIPMGMGSFTAPQVGTTEVAGIVTAADFRKRGIGAAVTALLTRTAFESGLDCAWLSPAGPDQERLYASIGYQSTGEMLFISLTE